MKATKNNLRYDISGPSENRFLIFSTDNLLNVLERSHTWLIDGTFKICPEIFGQVMSIHGIGFNDDNTSMPGLFALLAKKQTSSYIDFLNAVKSIIPNLKPREFICDFELGLHNAINEVYDEASITVCYFHFAQSQRRKLGGILSRAITIQLLAFRVITKNPDPALIEYIEYFQKYYVGHGSLSPRFRTEMWSVHEIALEGEAITNNNVEGTHHRLSYYFKVDHPELWLFIEKLRDFTRGLEADLTDVSHGKELKIKSVSWERIRIQRQAMLRTYNPARVQAFLTSMAGCIKP